MPFDAPFALGPFSVDSAGRLAPCGPDASPAFLFRWRERLVRARITQPDTAKGCLHLQVALGRVPSSVRTSAARPDSFSLVRLMAHEFPQDWRVRLLPDHRVRLEAEASLALPITAVALLVEVTRFLLALAPYLDMVDERGMAVPLSAAEGSAKT
jgi:hypothetical protein